MASKRSQSSMSGSSVQSRSIAQPLHPRNSEAVKESVSRVREFKAAMLKKQREDASKASRDGDDWMACEEVTNQSSASSQQSLERSVRQQAKSGQIILVNKELSELPAYVYRVEIETPVNMDVTLNKSSDEDKWWNAPVVTKLIVASNKLVSLHDDIRFLCNLNVLDAHDNQLASLPPTLGECSSLQKLVLNYNRLKSVPECVCRLKDLRLLNLNHNEIENLPEELSNLFYLEELDLSENRISSLPGSLNGLHIQKLNLSGNLLKSIPSELGWLQSLRVLDLSNNMLVDFPFEIGELRKLELLYLMKNRLTRVPCLKSCECLKELLLFNNEIRELEPEFFSCLPSLKILDLHENHLSSLPNNVTDCSSLERLILDRNDLTNIPMELCLLTHLKVLSVNGNPVRTIRKDIVQRGSDELLKFLRFRMFGDEKAGQKSPDSSSSAASIHDSNEVQQPFFNHQATDFVKAETLDLSNGSLSDISNAILSSVQSHRSVIRSLDLSRNMFSIFPESLLAALECSLLHTVNLANNKLTQLNLLTFCFVNLTTLNLSANCLHDLPESLSCSTKLRELVISLNKFVSFPSVIYSLKSVEVIIAHDNQIESLEPNLLIGHSKLSVLDLSNNNLRTCPPELGLLTSLRALELQGNPFKVPRAAQLAKGTDEVLRYLRDRLPLPPKGDAPKAES